MARKTGQRQLTLYSVGRFQLLNADGLVLEERTATALFGSN
jgi:hypothetical protein